jgi:hypothetical protein
VIGYLNQILPNDPRSVEMAPQQQTLQVKIYPRTCWLAWVYLGFKDSSARLVAGQDAGYGLVSQWTATKGAYRRTIKSSAIEGLFWGR